MDEEFYGSCDNCGTKVGSRHYTLSRHIEECIYPVPGMPGPETIYVSVLHAEELNRYCCSTCAEVGAYVQMQDRGIELKTVALGPIAQCSKCSQMIDLRAVHIAYEMTDQTELHSSLHISIEAHDSDSLAYVCKKCEPEVDNQDASTKAVNLTKHADRVNWP